MSPAQDAEVIVVGGGAMGSAAARQLAERGVQVLLRAARRRSCTQRPAMLNAIRLYESIGFVLRRRLQFLAGRIPPDA